MLTLLRRAEDLLIQVLRLVLLAFSIFVLFGMGHWIWDHYKPKKPDIATAGATALNWKDAPYDLKYMEEETGRDLSVLGNAVPMEKRLADPALRPDFRKADGLLRGFIYRDTAARKRVETENSSQGLDPIHPLLKGDALPSADDVNRQIKMREARENSCCDKEAADAAAAEVDAAWTARRISLTREDRMARAAADAAADAAIAAAAEASGEDAMLMDPVNLASEINDRAQAAEMEHGEGSYAAYIKGLPVALEKVLGLYSNIAIVPAPGAAIIRGRGSIAEGAGVVSTETDGGAFGAIIVGAGKVGGAAVMLGGLLELALTVERHEPHLAPPVVE